MANFETNLLPFDGELYLIKQFYRSSASSFLFEQLKANLAWQEETIFIYGRWLKVPRLVCWYGNSDACYRYSGVNHQPLPWTKELLAIKENVEQQCHSAFNSVLANLYRDGSDAMGYHADNEKQLGANPVIASLSLGDQRLFALRHKKSKQKIDIIISKKEYDELIKIQNKYNSLINKSILFLSNNNVYCKTCNSLSKSNANIKNHIFKDEL